MHDSENIAHRITCVVPQALGGRALEALRDLGVRHLLKENARNVRRRRVRRRFAHSGYVDRLDNSPAEIYRFQADPSVSAAAIGHLAAALEMQIPARGTIYAEAVTSHVTAPQILDKVPAGRGGRGPALLQDLMLITCIMSMSGSGQELAKVALELGTGVPIITLGVGTGLCDRLGLLRITVPPEKELVHLIAPAADADGLVRILIENGRLNRPGRGFIYCTPVKYGVLDTSVTIGRREHAASIEQIITAVDDLKQGTAWRRRFPEGDPEADIRLQRNNRAITVVCGEEQSRKYIQVAMQAGAAGATTSQVQRPAMGDASNGPRQRSTIVVEPGTVAPVVGALLSACSEISSGLEYLEVQPVPTVFSYHAASLKGNAAQGLPSTA